MPKNCTATGAGLERALLQQESEFIIQVRALLLLQLWHLCTGTRSHYFLPLVWQAVDKSLKPLLTGGAAFKCLIRGPAGPTVTIQGKLA